MRASSEETRIDGTTPQQGSDPEIQQIRARVKQMLELEPADPVRIGRFTILERAGAGGMGVVYSAYDPELDRRIAVKILRWQSPGSDTDSAGRTRLLREAQAMGRVSHPNVIAVYDVGTYQDRVYLAMEFVRGLTLRRWLRDRKRSWREVVDVFVQAGRGLAAAHAQGLIHRDFKPENVLIGEDDRVRVLDFGLARAANESGDPVERPKQPEPPHDSLSIESSLTETGTILGTPAYMSPEQHEGGSTTHASDQFSYAVALHEALFGQRPFPGKTVTELAQSIQTQKIIAPAGDERVPGGIRRAILRALAVDPQARWATMGALIGQLELELEPTRRWVWGAGAVAIGTAVIGYVTSGDSAPSPCTGGTAKIAQVWSPAHKQQIQQAFVATGRPYAGEVWHQIERAIDDSTSAWADTYHDNCSATALRREQPEDVYLQRNLCLEWQLQELQALTGVFAVADGDIVDQASEAVQGLEPPAQCSAERASLHQLRPPASDETRSKVREIQLQLAEASGLAHTGRYPEAFAITRAAIDAAESTAYQPIAAEAYLMLGRTHGGLIHQDVAEEALYRALELAEASRHDEVAADAWISLVHVVGLARVRPEDGLRFAQLARASIQRIGGDEQRLAAVLMSEGRIRFHQGKLGEALDQFHEALATLEALHGTGHPSVADPLSQIARVFRERGEFGRALEVSERALAIMEEARGANHPMLVNHLTNIGTILGTRGDRDRAVVYFERALRIREAAFGADYGPNATLLHNLGAHYGQRGDLAQALEYFQRALVLDERNLGLDNPQVAPSLYALGMTLLSQQRLTESADYLERALRLLESSVGTDHHNLTLLLAGLGQVRYAQGNRGAGRALLERAIAITREALGPNNPKVVRTLRDLGRSELEHGTARAALAPLEQAATLGDLTEVVPEELAFTRFLLARALWATRTDRQRARELAADAQTILARSGMPGPELQEIEAWLAEHP